MDRPAHQSIKRRAFLQALLATSLLRPGYGNPSEDGEDFGIIDTHTHLYDPSRKQGVPWPSPNDAVLYQATLPERLKTVATPHGVTGTVVVEASPWVEDNQWLLDLAKDEPFIVGVIGNLDPIDERCSQRWNRFVQNPLFRGIRIRPFQPEQTATIIEAMRPVEESERTLEINGSAVSLPGIVAIARKRPKLRIVIDPFPSIPSRISNRSR